MPRTRKQKRTFQSSTQPPIPQRSQALVNTAALEDESRREKAPSRRGWNSQPMPRSRQESSAAHRQNRPRSQTRSADNTDIDDPEENEYRVESIKAGKRLFIPPMEARQSSQRRSYIQLDVNEDTQSSRNSPAGSPKRDPPVHSLLRTQSVSLDTYSSELDTLFNEVHSRDNRTSRNSRAVSSIGLKGDEKRLFQAVSEKVCHRVWFIDPFVSPAENDISIERIWEETARQRGLRGVRIQKGVISNLKQKQSAARSYMTTEVAYIVQRSYNLDTLSPLEVKDRVRYLLKDDRYICHPSKYEVGGFRFAAPQIGDLIERKFFRGKRQKGLKDPTFITEINNRFIILAATCIGHVLKGWKSGVWVKPPEFKYETCFNLYTRHLKTWENLPEANARKLINDLRGLMMKRMSRIKRFDLESTEAYNDPAADEFLAFQVLSEDESRHNKDGRRTNRQKTPEEDSSSDISTVLDESEGEGGVSAGVE